MKKLLLILFIALQTTLFAQNTFKAILKNTKTMESLIGATAFLQRTTNGSSAIKLLTI